MPIYRHKCKNCEKEDTYLYTMSKDPSHVICTYCGSNNTERLIGVPHIGWERKIYNTFIKADEERGEAQLTDHMGPKPYIPMSGEEQNEE